RGGPGWRGRRRSTPGGPDRGYRGSRSPGGRSSTRREPWPPTFPAAPAPLPPAPGTAAAPGPLPGRARRHTARRAARRPRRTRAPAGSGASRVAPVTFVSLLAYLCSNLCLPFAPLWFGAPGGGTPRFDRLSIGFPKEIEADGGHIGKIVQPLSHPLPAGAREQRGHRVERVP